MSEVEQSRYFMFGLLFTAYVVVFPLAWLSGMQHDFSGSAGIIGFASVFALVFGTWCRLRGIVSLQAAVECFSGSILMTLPCAVTAYLAMRTGMPLADSTLLSIDRAFGIDWVSMIRFVDQHPALATALLLAYKSISLQILCVPALLALSGRTARSYRFISAYAMTVFAACIVSIGFPAFGTATSIPIDQSTLTNLNTHFWTDFVDQLHAVREDANFVFRIEDCRGIITFPSVHAGVSVLCTWAAWDLKLLRYPFLVLNLLMAASAFIIANHYVVDVVAGFAVAAACIFVVCSMTSVRRNSLGALTLAAG